MNGTYMNDTLRELISGLLAATTAWRYNEVVTHPDHSSRVTNQSTRRKSTLNTAYGEYAVKRHRDGKNHLYFIYFLRDPDGVWRLDEM
jgi:hypothetical protein